MLRGLLISCALLCSACERVSDAANRMPPAAAYSHFSDRVAAQMLHWGIPWRFPCLDAQEEDQCFKFTTSKRMHGLWRNEFEGSQFCPPPATQCANSRKPLFIWFQMKSPLPGWEDTPPGGLYAVDFIGRRSEYRGMYGHLGMSDEEVIVDRMISIKEVEAPTPGQMTKEHVQGYLKDCEGVQVCMPNSEAKDPKIRFFNPRDYHA